MARPREVLDAFLNYAGAPVRAAGSTNGLLIMCLLFHIYDVIALGFRQSSVRLGFYIIIAVFAWATVFKSDPAVMDVDDLKTPLILSTLSFLFPYLGNLIPFLQAWQFYQTLVVFFPVWVIYLAFSVGGTTTTNVIRWVIIGFWIFLFLPTFLYSLSADLNLTEMETGLNINQVIASSSSKLKSNVYRFWDNLKQIPTKAVNSLNKMMNYATGGLYASEVEKNEKEQIGVYLENLRSSDSKFYEGEKVTVWGNIKARTLEEDINIDISCYSEEGKNKIDGTATPEHMNVAGQEEEWIDCVFEELNPGRKKVVINAIFNFETKSYLKTYYMNKETLRTLNRENVDVLSKYGISHVNPITIFTNGPVGIGIGSVDPLPVGIWMDDDNVPLYFGISLDNRWEGKIREITELEVQVHDSLHLTNCDHDFEFVETNNEGYNVYHMVPSKKTQNITNFHTIRCRLEVEDPRSLLDNNPITTRYFRVSAKYIYELEKSTTVEIIKVEEYEEVTPEEKEIEVEDWEILDEGEIELKIRGAASNYGIPQHIALGIAMQESSMEHYNPDGSVKMSNANCMGLMQVQLDSRDGTYNSMCSMNKEDLKDINNNIECGMKILKGKYNMVCDSNDHPLIRQYIGKSEYELKVREWCKIDEHLNDYLEYDKDCNKMAIRAYNGLGCAENADVNYVEKVLDYAEKYK